MTSVLDGATVALEQQTEPPRQLCSSTTCDQPPDRTLWWARVDTFGHIRIVELTHECRSCAVESVRCGPALTRGCTVIAIQAGLRAPWWLLPGWTDHREDTR